MTRLWVVVALPACFRLADEVFPRVRAHAARHLVSTGHSQTQAARAVGVSQAMVSRYLSRPSDEDPLIHRLADELVTGSEASWCALLEAVDDGALTDLLEAERALMAAPPLRVMPQVGLNMARARPQATSPADVFAFPARIVEAGGRLVRPLPPSLGGSRHLAEGLLGLRRQRPGIAALANVRGGLDVEAALTRLDVPWLRLPTGSDLASRLCATQPDTILFHDAGGVGIEPCLYVAGARATDVSALILRLHQEVP